MHWNQLTHLTDLRKIIEQSHDYPIVVFKHSTRCGISSMVKKSFERELDKVQIDNRHFYYLDLIKHRDISNAIADELGVWHESPQVIVLKKGKAAFNASHHAISGKTIAEEIKKSVAIS